MTDHTPAAPAADTNPLSDEYVNAVIQQHGYQSPETVIARLNQWIGLHGGENGVTLLMYEAHKALVRLRAPVAHLGLPDVLPEFTNASGAQFVSMGTVGTVLRAARAALASAPIAVPVGASQLAAGELDDLLSDPSAMAALADGLESIKGNENAALAAVFVRREADRLATGPVAGADLTSVTFEGIPLGELHKHYASAPVAQDAAEVHSLTGETGYTDIAPAAAVAAEAGAVPWIRVDGDHLCITRCNWIYPSQTEDEAGAHMSTRKTWRLCWRGAPRWQAPL